MITHTQTAANEGIRPALIDVYPAFKERIVAFRAAAETDPVAAATIFAEAQELAKAFWAGCAYACGVEE